MHDKVKYTCKNCGWETSIRAEWADIRPKRCMNKKCNTSFLASPKDLIITPPAKKEKPAPKKETDDGKKSNSKSKTSRKTFKQQDKVEKQEEEKQEDSE